MEMEDASEGSSRSTSPPPPKRERLQRATVSSAQEYVDEDEEAPFDAVYNQPLTRWKEDDIHLQYAAANARLPFDSMTDLEMEMFPEYTSDQLHVNSYLYVRNMILNLWDMNPMYELALENVFDEMPVAYRSLSYLIVKTHAFLERHGLINFGVFSTVEELLKKNREENGGAQAGRTAVSRLVNRKQPNGIKIIVVGAGIAGLAAASQLKFFGFDVVVIEARDRVGGRVFTPENVQKTPCDMGPHLIEAQTGNPLMTLLNQTPVLRYPVRFECPIYDDEGVIDPNYCRKVGEHFRRLTEAVILLSKENQVHEIGGQWLSVQDAYDHMINMQEEKVAVQRREYFETIDKLAQRLLNQTKALDVAKSTMDELAGRLREQIERDPTPIREDVAQIENEDEFRRVAEIKCLRFELSEACNVYERLQAERNDVHHTLTTVRKNEPSEIYLSGPDRRLLDFFMANLELRLGTCLRNVSLSGFANLMVNHFGTHHYAVQQGMHALLKPLARRLRVQSGRIVTAIEYDERTDEAVVRFVRRPRTRPKRTVGPNGEEVREEVGEVESLRAHSVCCCLPLGVLRERPLPYARPAVDRAGVHLPNVRFEPPLPAATRALIQTAAAGSANKIVLVFKRRFWPEGVFFGRVNDKPCARGEFFLFSATPGGTVLNAWLSGAAANLSDSFSSNDLHTRVMKVLARMFGPECPKLPEQVIVTRWHEDEQTYGCFPYVRVGRSDEDFAALAQPVFVPLAAASSQEAALARPFLHFAGDHTSREFPGRLHGAFLSGLREAARIADYHLGAVNAPANQAEFERLGRLLADRLQPPKPDGRAHSED